MKSNSILDQEKFWKIIEYLVQLDQKESFNNICSNLSITKWQLNSFINFLKEVDYILELEVLDEGQKTVRPPIDKKCIKVEFSLLEWLELQAHFPIIASMNEKPYHKNIKSKLELVEEEYNNHDLFTPLPTLENIVDSNKFGAVQNSSIAGNGIIAFVEESILDKQVIQLVQEEKTYKVFPRKIIFIDGGLQLIGESISDGCLLSIPLKNTSNAFEEDLEWKMNFSKLEVEDFVKSFRLVSDNSIRLVLKLFSQEKFNLEIEHQYFENPCIFANMSGEHIWAATLEPNTKVFDWLFSLGRDVEILDPTEFKLEFIKYCENKLKKLA